MLIQYTPGLVVILNNISYERVYMNSGDSGTVSC